MTSERKTFHLRAPLGQHFLRSPGIAADIVAAARLDDTDHVLEIGSGQGVLTFRLSHIAKTVLAVEKDPRLAAALTEALVRNGIKNVRVIPGDILKLLPHLERIRYTIVANIPYYLTSRLIRMLLEYTPQPKNITLMVQKEVAERIVSKPPHMNLLALSVQLYAHPKILFGVSKKHFAPPPKVDSAVISITPYAKSPSNRQGDTRGVLTIAKAAFSGKRKILENTLSKNLGLPKAKIASILGSLDLSHRRPEALSIDHWAKLINALSKLEP